MDLQQDLLQRLLWLVPLTLSLTVHEWAHAAMADWLGDDTARLLGRKSFDPLVHLDPLGSLLPLLGIPLGWAKPVPINPLRFHPTISMKFGVLLVAVAGPVSNLVIAVGIGLLSLLPIFESQIAHGLLFTIMMMNLGLAVFNLIPLPPLDGSRIVDAVIPDRFRPAWNCLGAIGPVVIVVLFVAVPLLARTILSNQ